MPETEGLPMLGVSMATIVNNQHVNGSSLKNGTANMLTPLTNDNIPPKPGELPDCPKCRLNEWTMTPVGDYLCSCGHKLKG